MNGRMISSLFSLSSKYHISYKIHFEKKVQNWMNFIISRIYQYIKLSSKKLIFKHHQNIKNYSIQRLLGFLISRSLLNHFWWTKLFSHYYLDQNNYNLSHQNDQMKINNENAKQRIWHVIIALHSFILIFWECTAPTPLLCSVRTIKHSQNIFSLLFLFLLQMLISLTVYIAITQRTVKWWTQTHTKN